MAIIKVKSAQDGNRVAFWQQHPDHPGGEVFIKESNDDVHEVADTAAVNLAIREGKLVEVKGRGKKAAEE